MIEKNYSKLIEKLTALCGYNKVLCDQDFPSIGILKSYNKIRSEVCELVESECGELLQLLVSSGILEIYYGDVDGSGCVVLDTKAICFMDNKFIEIEAGTIQTSSMGIPSNLVKWFSDKYCFIPLKNEEDMPMNGI